MEYIVFKLNKENYTIPLGKIKEILVYSQIIITDLFAEAPWIKGVINLRGEVLPIVDLRVRFNIKNPQYGDDTVAIVIKTSEDKLVAIIVDSISSIMELKNHTVSPIPSMGVGIDEKYVEGLVKMNNEQMAALLDIDMILKIEELV
jgi:purine-binding chemotaxis protein CheW